MKVSKNAEKCILVRCRKHIENDPSRTPSLPSLSFKLRVEVTIEILIFKKNQDVSNNSINHIIISGIFFL